MAFSRIATRILEQQAGAGTFLIFPGVSTCTACVCVLNDELVGVHATMRMSTGTGNDAAPWELARELIGEAAVNRLYIIGWDPRGSQSISAIREHLRCTSVDTYVCDLNNAAHTNGAMRFSPAAPNATLGGVWRYFAPRHATDLAILAEFTDRTTMPTFSIKRQSKVTVTPLPGDRTRRFNRFRADSASVTKTSDHFHYLRGAAFTRV